MRCVRRTRSRDQLRGLSLLSLDTHQRRAIVDDVRLSDLEPTFACTVRQMRRGCSAVFRICTASAAAATKQATLPVVWRELNENPGGTAVLNARSFRLKLFRQRTVEFSERFSRSLFRSAKNETSNFPYRCGSFDWCRPCYRPRIGNAEWSSAACANFQRRPSAVGLWTVSLLVAA
jgi:hypothetical protein